VLKKTLNQNRSAAVILKNQKDLEQLGDNIKLARTRRGYTQILISERTGLSRLTIRNIERGDPKVSIGHYVVVLSMLGLTEDFSRVASEV
jgi:DNA-binding XRE family transcriptional regulator